MILCQLLLKQAFLVFNVCVLREKLTLNFLRCLEKNCQRFQSKNQVRVLLICVTHAYDLLAIAILFLLFLMYFSNVGLQAEHISIQR